MRFLVRVLGNMLGIWISSLVIDSIRVEQGTTVGQSLLILAVAAFVLAVVNSLVRPVVRVVAFPLYVLTFGLFALVTNALVFALAGWLTTRLGLGFEVGGFWAAVVGGTITAIVAALVVGAFGRDR